MQFILLVWSVSRFGYWLLVSVSSRIPIQLKIIFFLFVNFVTCDASQNTSDTFKNNNFSREKKNCFRMNYDDNIPRSLPQLSQHSAIAWLELCFSFLNLLCSVVLWLLSYLMKWAFCFVHFIRVIKSSVG